jgi:hypothetical protein
MHYFLGILVKKHQGGLLLTQERYANDILAWSGMDKCKSIDTPERIKMPKRGGELGFSKNKCKE